MIYEWHEYNFFLLPHETMDGWSYVFECNHADYFVRLYYQILHLDWFCNKTVFYNDYILKVNMMPCEQRSLQHRAKFFRLCKSYSLEV
jgi:hypothetical protein